MRPAGEETVKRKEPAWGNSNTTEYKDPRIDLLDSGFADLLLLFNAVYINEWSIFAKGLTPVDRGVRP